LELVGILKGHLIEILVKLQIKINKNPKKGKKMEDGKPLGTKGAAAAHL